ncbi:MAG: hypothetical protein QMD05_09475, partial [Candidatus Brocadiaceae bacterium]|nr:hypothetical protein [Candidatus Brocadiaceae bacterium]
MPIKYILGSGDKVDFGAVGLKNATGQAGKLLKVKATEDLLEYLAQGSGGGLDADKVDGYEASALEKIANKGIANGYAGLDASGKVPSSQLPALALTDVWTVASQAAQLALTAEEGDVAIRTDLNKSYAHNGGTSGTMADWSELLTPTDTVLSVFGRTGAVVAQIGDYTWAQINKTVSDIAD